MKLLIQNTRITGLATDEYSGPDIFINMPLDFDVEKLNKYRYVNNILFIPDPADNPSGNPINDVPLTTNQQLIKYRLLKIEEINNARLKANETSFKHRGKLIACDKLSKDDITATNNEISNLGRLPAYWPGGWKTIDNSYIVISNLTQWHEFHSAMYNQGIMNFAKSQWLKARLLTISTVDEIKAVSWSNPPTPYD